MNVGMTTTADLRDAIYSGRRGEALFQSHVLGLLRARGWQSYHAWSAIHSRAGFPDLVAWRDERLLFAELKAPRGRLSAEQAAVIEGLRATGAEVYVWYPRDWDEIEGVLR